MPDLREAAEGLPKILDDAAHWIEACPFENALPHATLLVNKGLEIEAALAAPDPVAELEVLVSEAEARANERGRAVSEAGEIIHKLLLLAYPAEKLPLTREARDWLQRNGGTE